MEIKIIPQNDKFLLGLEVKGNELELLKLEREYRVGKLKHLIYNLEFTKNKASFTLIKDDYEIIKDVLKKIEKEAKEEVDNNDN